MNRSQYVASGSRTASALAVGRQRRMRATDRTPEPGVGMTSSAGSSVSWSFWLRVSVVAFILVYVGRIHEALPGVGRIPVGNVVTLAVGGLLVLGGYLQRIPALGRVSTLRWTAAFVALAALSIPFALWPGGAAGIWIGILKSWLMVALLPLLITTTGDLRLIVRAFTVAAAVLVAGYVLEAFPGLGGFIDQESLSFDRNDVALLAAMAIPFSLAWAQTRGRIRYLGYGLAGFLVAGIIATGSRGGFLAMAAIGIAFLVRSKILSGPKKALIAAVAIGLASYAGSGEYWDRVEAIFVNPTEDYNFEAREGRIEIWKRALGYAADDPVTGVGIGNFPVAEGSTLENLGWGVKWSTAHNAYLLVLAELGLPGFLVFMFIIWSIWTAVRDGRRFQHRQRAPPSSALAAEAYELSTIADATGLALLGYMVGAMFLSVAYTVAFAFLVAVGAALHLLRGRIAMRMMQSRARVSRAR